MNPTARTLVTILENQQRRTEAAFEGLGNDLFTTSPGGDTHTICEIGLHLLALRCFLLTILESSRATEVDGRTPPASVGELTTRLAAATETLREEIETHDDADWHRVPDPPRQGMWGDEPTIVRFSRPFNDYVNHLGSIRVIRRIAGDGAERTQ